MQNSAEQIYTLFGAAYINAIESAINTAYRGEFLSSLLAKIEAKVLLVDDDLLPHVAAVARELPRLEKVLVRPRGGPALAAGSLPASVDCLPIEFLLAGDPTTVLSSSEPRWNAPSSIQYTSGTTGPSKAALFSQNYIVHVSRAYSAWWYRDADDVFYTGLPIFHGLAKLLGVTGSIYRGATCVLDERFSLTKFWDNVRRHRATATAGPEAVLTMLWNLAPSAAEVGNSLHTIVAAPIPADLHRAMEE
jgi:crotonobetaine/carnitine-CoA ligase